MALLRWNKKYSVGVNGLDSEHAAFLRSLNRLHAAMIKGQGKDVTGRLLRGLPDGARAHFASEELLMKNTNYPGLAEHRARHEEFARYLNELATLMERGERGLSILLLHFMREWITNHIQQDDKAYAPWLDEHHAR
jgi:hemerythrin